MFKACSVIGLLWWCCLVTIKYPETWEQMNDGETFKKVRLTTGTKECLGVEARIRKEAGATINEIITVSMS